ncbi:MAG: response regulator [Bacteroidota bacterium]|nr:response regulator [Bacteroidota bacterium]
MLTEIRMPAITYLVVIEDNEADILLMKKRIDEACPDTELMVFRDGNDAMRWIREESFGNGKHKIPDGVLLDINMPKWSGLELLKAIRDVKELREMPVVMFSSSDRPYDVEKSMEFKASAFFVKPFTLEGYDNAIRDVCAFIRKEMDLPFFNRYDWDGSSQRGK